MIDDSKLEIDYRYVMWLCDTPQPHIPTPDCESLASDIIWREIEPWMELPTSGDSQVNLGHDDDVYVTDGDWWSLSVRWK